MSQLLVEQTGIQKVIDILRMVARTKKYIQTFGRWGDGVNTACAMTAISMEMGCGRRDGDNENILFFDELQNKMPEMTASMRQNIVILNDSLRTYDQIADFLESKYLK
jgi:hypothetical protein